VSSSKTAVAHSDYSTRAKDPQTRLLPRVLSAGGGRDRGSSAVGGRRGEGSVGGEEGEGGGEEGVGWGGEAGEWRGVR